MKHISNNTPDAESERRGSNDKEFWTREEKNFFNCIKSIENSNMFIAEKKYYIMVCETLFEWTNYFRYVDNLKRLWNNKDI